MPNDYGIENNDGIGTLGGDIGIGGLGGDVIPKPSPEPVESVKVTESIKVVESVKPVESIRVTESTKVNESVKPVESIRVTESTKVNESVKPVESIKVTESTKVNESVKPVESVKVTESTKVNESIRVVESTKVNESVKVTESTKVNESVKPVESIRVTESTKVNESVKPVESIRVVESTKVNESVKPVESIKVVVSTPVTSTPVTSTPVTSTPVTSTPVTSTPVTSTPVTSTPVTSTPVTSTPVTSTPVVSTPVTSTPVVSTPVVPTPDPEPTPDPTPSPDPDPTPDPGPVNPDDNDAQKYHLDEKTLKQIEVTDENGEKRQVWVAQTVADRKLETVGTDGEKVLVADVGDHGGYVEVKCDKDGNPIKNKDGTLPLPVPAGEDGVKNGKGGLKGLSQNDMSWTQPGTYLVGNAGITKDAQLIGPDAVISGSDQITGEVGIGGSGFRSSGQSTFDGNGSYIDMQMDPGAKYEFTGGTQIGGPAHFKKGEGVFCDDEKTGRITMMFAARDGSELEVSTMHGFHSNGMTALDDSVIAGGFKGNPDMVVQDSTVATFAKFEGPVTVVNQYVGMDANNMTITSDADLDEVALTQDPKDPLTTAYNTSGSFEDQADYLAHVSDKLTHELGEQYADTGVQHHYEDVHADMNNDLEDKWEEIKKIDPSMTRQDFDALYRNLSGYHDGINDAVVEDYAVARKEGGDKAVAGLLEGVSEEERAKILEGGDAAVQSYLDKNGIEGNVADVRKNGAEAAIKDYQATREAGAWWQGHERRADAITQTMYDRTSGTSQWVISGDPMTCSTQNTQAAQGLHGTTDWKDFGKEGEPVIADAPAGLTETSTDDKPKDWRLGLANKLPTGTTEPQKDDDQEYGG